MLTEISVRARAPPPVHLVKVNVEEGRVEVECLGADVLALGVGYSGLGQLPRGWSALALELLHTLLEFRGHAILTVAGDRWEYLSRTSRAHP